MSAWTNRAARTGLAVALFLLVLAVLRWAPVYAEPPWDVRARPAAAAAVLLGVAAAVTGRERRASSARPWWVALAAVLAALAGAVVLRGPAGLPAEVRAASGDVVGSLGPGPVDLLGRDLRHLPATRKWTARWEGPLRAPETGTYRLWTHGRGRVEVAVDGRRVLAAEGETFRAGSDLPLGRGEHRLEVTHDRMGAGARLRLGWTRPRAGGRPGGRAELVPPRHLGPSRPRLGWVLTDLLALAAAALVAAIVLVVPWDRPRRLPARRDTSRREVALATGGYALLAAAMSWPLVLDLAGSGMTDRPDGRLNAWILAWDVQALLHGATRLFEAPIFHPLPDALAFSENLLVPAVLAAPAIVTGGPVFGYNVALLVALVVSGIGTHLLIRRAGGSGLAAFVGGAVFAVGAHRWIRLAHLHAQVTLFLPFVLVALDRFWERRTLRRALSVGVLLALQGLSSVYLGAIAALLVAAAVAAALAGGLGRDDGWRLAAGLALAALLMAPAAAPYLEMRAFQGMEWTLEDVSTYATTLDSYAASGTRLYGGLTQRHLDPDRVRDTLFPGLVPLVLGVAGLASAPRRYRAVALLASAAAIVVSLGPETGAYRVLYEHVVLFRGVRALSRFSLVPVLALSVMCGLALSGRRWAALPALVLLLVESSNLPLRYAPYRPPPPVARWLAQGDGAVAYLPLGERDTEVMLDGVAHFRPLVNGDSGFVPRPYTRAMELLQDETPGGLRFLRAIGVRHVVTRDPRALPLLERFGEDRVYGVPAGEAARVVRPGTTAVSLWAASAVVVDLAAPGTVSRVQFTLDERPWVERPTLEVSLDGVSWERVEAEASLADATLSLYADPRRALGEVSFAPRRTRFVRLDPDLPARPGVVWVGGREDLGGEAAVR